LPVRVIPGIGPKTELFMHGKDIRTIAALRAVAPAQLTEWFGRWGDELHRKACGVSDSLVSNEWTPKSVGEQETFEDDTLEAAFILERARELTAQVFRRFLAERFRGFRTVTVTVRFADFVTTSRSHTAHAPLTSRDALDRDVLRLLLPFLDARENPRRKRIRLIGVRVEKLLRETEGQGAQALIGFDEGLATVADDPQIPPS